MNQITETVSIEGMSCAGSCVRRVSSALEKVEGIEVGEVKLGSATIRYDPERAGQTAIAQAIREAGFKPVFTTS